FIRLLPRCRQRVGIWAARSTGLHDGWERPSYEFCKRSPWSTGAENCHARWHESIGNVMRLLRSVRTDCKKIYIQGKKRPRLSVNTLTKNMVAEVAQVAHKQNPREICARVLDGLLLCQVAQKDFGIESAPFLRGQGTCAGPSSVDSKVVSDWSSFWQ